MADDLDVGINVHGEGAEVAKQVAEGVKQLRKELELLAKVQNSGDAKAAAAAEIARLRQLDDERRASAINIRNLQRKAREEEQAAAREDRAFRKQMADDQRALGKQMSADERSRIQAERRDRQVARAEERAAAKQRQDELRASARNISVLRKNAAAEQKAATAALRDATRAQKEHEAAQRRAVQAQKDALNATQAQQQAIKGLIREVLALAAVFVGAQTFKAFIDMGLKFNEVIETSNLGIASLITSQTKMTDSSGRVIDGVEKLGIAQALATDQVNKLRVAGLRTVATTEQLVIAFQQATGVGLRWGLTLDQIRILTVQVSQAAGALGVPLNQLNEEIRSLLTGTITPRNTRIATALGITNAQIKQAQQAGTLFEFVTKRLEAFSVAGEATAKTFRGVMSNIREAIENLAGDATKPLFDALKINAQKTLESIFDLDTARVSDSLRGILDVAQNVFGGLGDLLGSAMHAGVEGAQELSKWLQKNAGEVDLILRSTTLLGSELKDLSATVFGLLIPFAEISVKTGFISNVITGTGLVVADIRTLFDAILVALGAIGTAILYTLIRPITFLLTLIAKAVRYFDKDLADSIDRAAQAGNDWLASIGQGVSDYSKSLEVGNTATEQYIQKVEGMRKASESAVAGLKALHDALDNTSEFEKNLSNQLLLDLKNKVISQKEYAQRSRELQLIVVNQQIAAQLAYLNSLDATNEGDRERTRVLIRELQRRKSALEKDITLTSIAEPTPAKDSAIKREQGATALIKAELANRLKDLKIELDNQRLSYAQYYTDVIKANQDAIDKMIVVQKRLLTATTDEGAKAKILDQIKILEAQKLQVVEDSNEKRRQDEIKLGQELTQAHVQLLKDEGHFSEARALEIGDKFKKLIAQLRAEGDAAGADIVSRLFDIDNAKASLDELNRRTKTVFDALSLTLSDIEQQRKAGDITELTAQDRILAAHIRAQTQLENLIPLMREFAKITGDPEQVAAVENLAIKLKEISTTVAQTSDQFFKLKSGAKEAGTQGLVDLLDQLTEGAKSFDEIWRDVARSVVASLRQIASQMLANLLIQQALALFGGAVGSVGGVGGGGTVVPSAEAGVPVAAGGYITGPGTSTSDSIHARLSTGEYVVNAAAVRNVGVDFLHAINESASSGVSPRRRSRGYAEGGLVSNARGANLGGFEATIGLEPGLVARHIESREGTQAVFNVISKNRKTVRGMLGPQ